MLEWLKRHAWKACNRRNRFRGSNPRLSACEEGFKAPEAKPQGESNPRLSACEEGFKAPEAKPQGESNPRLSACEEGFKAPET